MKLKDLFVESFKIEEKPLVDFSGILGKLVGAEFSWLVKNHSNKIEYVNPIDGIEGQQGYKNINISIPLIRD